MKVPQFFVVQWAVLGIALGAADPPPLPSYNFGITGEPTKVDTAFGNLGELGPAYDVPEARNDSIATISGGNPQLGSIEQTTEQPKVAQSTIGKLNSSNVEEITTVKITYGEETTLPGTGSALRNGTEKEEKPLESSRAPNPTQNFETTTASKEQPTLSTTESGNNITSNTSNTTNMITTVTSSENSSKPSTPSSSPSTPSNTLSSTQGSMLRPSSTQGSTLHPSSTQGSTLHPSSTQGSTLHPSSTQGSMPQANPDGPLSQTFHTTSPNPTSAPTIILPSPGHNDTKPGENSTVPSKPNSSLSLYPNIGNMWLALAVISFYVVNTKYK